MAPSLTQKWSGTLLHVSKWNDKFRRMAAPTISAFLCFIFVVIGPLNRLAGRYSFLTYTSFLLFFMPRGTISGQLETTILGMLGVIFGLGWSCGVLAIGCGVASIHGADSAPVRGVLGLGLGILALICGFVRTRYQKLSTGSRIGMFYSIFLITSNQGVTSMESRFFTDQLAVAGFAAIFALIPALVIFPHTSEPRLGALIIGTLHSAAHILPSSLSIVMDDADDTAASTKPINPEKAAEEQPRLSARHDQLCKILKNDIASMRNLHSTYSLEVVHARLPPPSLLPLIKAISRLQSNPLLGPTNHVPGERIRAALERSAGREKLYSQAGTPKTMRFGRESGRHTPSDDERNANRNRTLSPSSLRHKLLQISTENRDSSWLSSAMSTPKSHDLVESSRILSEAIMSTFAISADIVADVYDWENGKTEKINLSQSDPAEIKRNLEVAIEELDKGLGGLLDPLLGHSRDVQGGDESSTPEGLGQHHSFRDKDRFRSAFYMTALRDLAKDALHILAVSKELSDRAFATKRWMLPSLLRLWKADTSTHLLDPVTDDPSTRNQAADLPDTDDTNKALDDLNFVEETLHQSRVHPATGDGIGSRFERAWRQLWDHRGVVEARVKTSRGIHHLRHSRHVLFALKFGGGISLLSLPAFLPPDSAGRQWYDSTRGAWTVISYMYVLEVTTGATFRVGIFRTIGTFVGALAAFICALIAKKNPYGLVALATLCSVPIHYGMLFSRRAPIALVAGITLPPVLFLPYLGLDNGQDYFTLAWTRFTDITIGIAAAVLVNLTIWPIHARVQYFHVTCEILDQCSELYLRMSRDHLRSTLVYRVDAQQYTRMEEGISRNITHSRGLVDIQRREVSLLPRPIKLYSEIIDSTERLTEIFADIRTLRFGVPRKATVLDVLPLRREVVSAILITLFALAHAFRSRTPLPQFIPSPRIALAELMDAVDEHARQVRRQVWSSPLRPGEVDGTETGSRGRASLEIAIVYAMAEGEALAELCQVLDELVAAARRLFGTRAFLDAAEHDLH